MGCGNSKENSSLNPLETLSSNQNSLEELITISKTLKLSILKNNKLAYITNNKIIISPLSNTKNNPDEQIIIEIENFEIKNFIEFSKDKIIAYGDKGFYIINLIPPNSFEIIDDFDEKEVGKINFILELNIDCFITVTENNAKIWIKHNDTYISYKEIEHPEKIENIKCNELLFYLEGNYIVVGGNGIIHLINFDEMKLVKDIVIGKEGNFPKKIVKKDNNNYFIIIEEIGITEWKINEEEWKRILIRKEKNLNIIGKLTDNKIIGFINENSSPKIVLIK